MISARTRLSGLSVAAAFVLLASASSARAEPVPPSPPSPPAGPVPVPYPNPDPPPVPECPYSLCPKAAGTLQFAGGASTIEVESFSWGASAVAEEPTTINTSDPQEGGEIAEPEKLEIPNLKRSAKPKVSEIPVVKRSDQSSPVLFSAPAPGKPAQSAIPRATVNSPRDVSSGQASGKRQHMPIRMTHGSVDVTMPEGVCVAGSHYPAVTLRSGDQAYEMRDVTVASCTPMATAKGKKDKAKLDYMVVTMETVLISG